MHARSIANGCGSRETRYRAEAPLQGARPRRTELRFLLLVGSDAVDDFLLGGIDAFPAQHLDPLARFQVLVVLEEVADRLQACLLYTSDAADE